MDISLELSTDAVSELFFSQIRRMSIDSCRPDAVHACSLQQRQTVPWMSAFAESFGI